MNLDLTLRWSLNAHRQLLGLRSLGADSESSRLSDDRILESRSVDRGPAISVRVHVELDRGALELGSVLKDRQLVRAMNLWRVLHKDGSWKRLGDR